MLPATHGSPTIDSAALKATPDPSYKGLFLLSFIASLLFWAGLGAVVFEVTRYYGAHWELEPEIQNRLLGASAIAGLLLLYIWYFLGRVRHVALLQGHAVAVGPKQFPDLDTRLTAVAGRLKIANPPSLFLVHRPMLAGTHSIRYRHRDFLAVNSETVGALTDRQSAIDFLMGRELARLNDPFNRWRYLIWPASVLPILGPALSRARIYTYDRFGIAACKTKVDAAFALSILACGTRRWKSVNIPEFSNQSSGTTQFWMAVQELMSDTPWLAKRMAHLRAIATESDTFIPRRHPLAFLLAAVVPYARLTSLVGLAHILLIAGWVGLGVHWGPLAWAEIEARLPRAETPAVSESVKPGDITGTKDVSPYTRLDRDLKHLGDAVARRATTAKDNPCEISNISARQLNFSAGRYAFSCEEPLVYTRVDHGEFEAGEPAHIRAYQWRQKKIIEVLGKTPK